MEGLVQPPPQALTPDTGGSRAGPGSNAAGVQRPGRQNTSLKGAHRNAGDGRLYFLGALGVGRWALGATKL